MAHPASISAQRTMKMDADLKNNSTPMPASRKGISAVGKYEFGQYRIISGKSGWKTTNSTKRFLSFETNSESKSKSSFMFLANGKDTLNVNISLNTKTSQIYFAEFSTLSRSNDNFIAIISSPADTVVWRLILAASSGEEVKEHFIAEGNLTDSVNQINIKMIKLLENGKKLLMNANCVFEFIWIDKVIAAVQTSIDVSLKRTVWLRSDIDEELKKILAAASASLMIYTDYQESATD
jgi:hypothetical protein